MYILFKSGNHHGVHGEHEVLHGLDAPHGDLLRSSALSNGSLSHHRGEAALEAFRAFAAGQRIGQWVDNSPTGSWNLVKTADGFYRLQSVKNTGLYLTGASAGAPLTLQTSTGDGSQEWELVE